MVYYPSIDLYGLKLYKLESDTVKNRNKLRQLVIKQLWGETPGEGKKEKTAHYTYYVEKLSDGNRVFITRPAVRRFGFDFIIHVEQYVFINNKDNPKHDDIKNDLILKKQKEPVRYSQLKKLIDNVFLCNDPDDYLINTINLDFRIGFSADLILKVCKWFFIEQDIRYWNYSGRRMLRNAIDTI